MHIYLCTIELKACLVTTSEDLMNARLLFSFFFIWKAATIIDLHMEKCNWTAVAYQPSAKEKLIQPTTQEKYSPQLNHEHAIRVRGTMQSGFISFELYNFYYTFDYLTAYKSLFSSFLHHANIFNLQHISFMFNE